jgi:hypothetical protein
MPVNSDEPIAGLFEVDRAGTRSESRGVGGRVVVDASGDEDSDDGNAAVQHVVDHRDVWPRWSYGEGLVDTRQLVKRSVRETIVAFVVRRGACGLLEHRPNVGVESRESRLQEPVDTVVVISMPKDL